MIITIDGPAGSGKSTAAIGLAQRLGIPYLDTGAMYRAITLKALDTDTSLDDPSALARLAEATSIELECQPSGPHVLMDGRDVTEAIRAWRVNQHTNPISSNQDIRNILIEKQRHIGRRLGSLVTEGRDQGSVVFTNADVKFFLTATAEERARRRCEQLAQKEQHVDFQEVLSNLRTRDGNDSRQWQPLIDSGQAVVIDNSDMVSEQVLDEMCSAITLRCPDYVFPSTRSSCIQ